MFSTIISSGASLSEPIPGGDYDFICGVVISSAWTAANLSFQGSYGTTSDDFLNVYDSLGNELIVIASASRYIPVDPTSFAGLKRVKIRSGTSGAPVSQGANRKIGVVTRPIR